MNEGAIQGERAYEGLVQEIITTLQEGRARAIASVAEQRFMTYHAVGRAIITRQQEQGWGAQVIKRLAADLRLRFPDRTGLGARNLQYMCTLAREWPDPNCAAAAAQLPWGHVMVLLDRLDDPDVRVWYAARAVADGWSRGVLEDRIKGRLHARVGAAPSNFPNRLAPADSDLAQQATRDPVLLDFLGLAGPVHEHAVETAMVDNLTRTMLELGDGLAFVGRQVPLRVGDHEFTADLIFLQYQPAVRFIVVELKVGRFDPRDAGQLSFYVQAVERHFRNPDLHAETIGILLCTSRDDQVVEYSLASTAAPVAVATYTYDQLPEDVRQALPPADSITRAIDNTKP
mgnify:FL=1